MLRRLILAWHFRRAHSKNPQVRFAATQALLLLGDERAFGLLVKCLADQHGDNRVGAAWELAKLKDSRAVEPLVSALSHGDDLLSRMAAEALGMLDQPRGIVPLIRSLGSQDPWLRLAAAKALRQLGEPKWETCIHGDSEDLLRVSKSGDARAVQPIIAALTAGNVGWREAAVEALGVLGELAVDPLVQTLKESNKELRSVVIRVLFDVRKKGVSAYIHAWPAVAQLLAKRGDTQAVAPLMEALAHKNGTVRVAAAKSLAQFGETKWTTWVIGDDRDLLRLGECGDKRIVAPLMAALSDAKHPLPYLAAAALGRLGDRRAVEPLVIALRSGDAALKRTTAEALGKLSDGRAIGPLMAKLAYKDAAVRLAVAEALWQLGEKKWRTWVTGDERDIRRLGECGDSRAVDALVTALGDEKHPLRSEAAQALGKLGDERALQPLATALTSKTAAVACAAAAAFGELALALAMVGDWRAGILLSTALHKAPDKATFRAAAEAAGTLGMALWKRADPHAGTLIQTALRHGDENVRRDVADALGRLGDEKSVWQLINQLGPNDQPIREALVRHANACAIALLCRALEFGGIAARRSAAKVCIELARSRPDIIGDSWVRIRARVTSRHEDESHHTDRRNESTDCCSYSTHTDRPGIGLDFPDRPAKLRQTQGAGFRQDAKDVTTRTCPACGKVIKAPARSAGRAVRCPMCNAATQIPSQPSVQPPARPTTNFPRHPKTLLAVCPNPGCGKRLKTAAENAGRSAKCPHCGMVFRLQPDVGNDVKPDF